MIIVKNDFNLKFNPKTVMQLMDCSESSPIYDEMLEEFYDLSKIAIKKIKPITLMTLSEIPKVSWSDKLPEGTKALFCLISVGNELSECSSSAFSQGDYVSGLMYDVMSDDILFQLDGLLKQDVMEFCKNEKLGIIKRLEAPTDVEMESQKLVWTKTDAYNLAGVNIKDSFMFDPVKSIAQIYLLNDNCEIMNLNHSCKNCASYDVCKLRKSKPKKITVLSNKINKDIIVYNKQSILDALIANEIYVPAICGGRGTCGKCKVTVLDGDVPISKEDRNFFSENELKNGMRLSCKAYPETDCVISLGQDENNFEVLTNYSDNQNKNNIKNNDSNLQTIVVDIGTTTIAMQRIDSITGKVYDTYTTINKQRAFGADVINRIQASNEGKTEKLKNIIRNELHTGINNLTNKNENISRIIIAGNTTMIHLFMGYSCETLGVYPFNAYNLNTIDTTFDKIPLTILPSISTFVGADITSGILTCNIGTNEKINMLIDIGTNGEMVIGNKDKILVTSTAAGPAFEGGNISCGTGSIQGAVCSIKMTDGIVSSIKTIGDKQPIGICGTGVIEIVSELLENELIDETGLLDEDYFENGFIIANSKDNKKIYLTQKDIREIQLAKSAIQAGLETLILRYGISYNDIDTVYIAGGFGYKMNIEKAINIGMLPEQFREKIVLVGNSSLNGCAQYATNKNIRKEAEEICNFAEEINLSNDKDFNNLYTQHMFFNNIKFEEEL